MRVFKSFIGVVAAAASFSACEIFEDQTPRRISIHMDGPAGATVSIIYSKQFVAGVDEIGVTRVEVFGADTVQHVLPVDTIVDVQLEQRLFLQAEVLPTDTLGVNVRIDVDGRSLFDRAGDLFPDLPWRFIYQFNHRFTDNIDVVI